MDGHATELQRLTRAHHAGAGRYALLGLALLVLWLAAAVWGTGPAQAQAELRLALVVGNSTYRNGPLVNPKNDAELISKALKAVGFTVTKLIDADQKAMRKAIVEFGRKLRTTEAVGLFYYAGHAVQVEGENFLVPIGADITAEQEVAVEGLNLGELLKTMERSSNRVNIVILDACRNNPFEAMNRSGGGGLATVNAPAGTLVAFATAPGKVATDGEGANGPYSAALAQALQVPGLSLDEVFRRTRRQVLTVTNGRQTPWENTSLTVEFFFRPKAAEPESSRRPAEIGGLPERQVDEIKAWERIKTSQDPQVLRQFIDSYPGGLLIDVAKLRLDQIKAREADGSTVAGWLGGLLGTTRGDPEAERLLEEGLKLEAKATPEALAEAFQRYKAAAGRGLPAAMHQLARAYDKGRGVERSLVEAASWYQKASELGHPPSMAALGTLYEFAEGVPVDLAEALRLYKLSAEAGEAQGMASLGYLYQQGKGVARDPTEARRWYVAAAEKGNARAMYNLALMHTRGDGGPRDFAAAVTFLNQAIATGHVGAHRELAFLYDEGHGVKRDAQAAARHLLIAYKAGHRDARMDLLTRPEAWSAATRREVQKQLQAAGVYKGRITGYFDPATRKAIETYGQ
ncbi:MAG: caspase family protein [Hyphomicrobiaceae bacterium]